MSPVKHVKLGVVLLIMCTYLMYLLLLNLATVSAGQFISFITQIVVRFETGGLV